MTLFEKAKLRLFAFSMLDGWGEKADTKDAEWRAWDMGKRRARALELADWAMTEDEPEKPEQLETK